MEINPTNLEKLAQVDLLEKCDENTKTSATQNLQIKRIFFVLYY